MKMYLEIKRSSTLKSATGLDPDDFLAIFEFLNTKSPDVLTHRQIYYIFPMGVL